KAPASGADIWVVTYDDKTVNVPVSRGENTGHTLPHKNVVHSLSNLGNWNGKAVSLHISPAKPGLRTAVLIQAPHGGPILAAATN
ncbi:MAG: DUF1223 domain-containing protein, partial [Bifidobacteriales bacterium]|nr:DUF1223 domain-containing protein [Bifidobacteriales bacterium]